MNPTTNYLPSVSNGSYGCYLFPTIDLEFRLQRRFRKIVSNGKYSPSISAGSYGTYLYPLQQRVVANGWDALPINARSRKHAKNTQQITLQKKRINEISPDSFAHFTNLRELYLNYNLLCNQHSLCLTNLCKPLFRLFVLDLSYNLLTNLQGLQYLSSLRHLNVSNNFISILALDQTLRILQKQKFLEYLDIRYNPLTLNHDIDLIENAFISKLKASLKVLNHRQIAAQNKEQQTSSFCYRDGKVIAFDQTFDSLKSRYSSYDAGGLTTMILGKGQKITKHRKSEYTNYLRKAYTLPEESVHSIHDCSKPYMYVKSEDMQSTVKQEAFRFSLKNEIVQFLKTNSNKKEISSEQIKACIEKDRLSTRYQLSPKSKTKFLNRFYFDVPQSEIDEMVQREIEQSRVDNDEILSAEQMEKLKQEKEKEVRQKMEENKKKQISENGKLLNMTHKQLLNVLMEEGSIHWIEKSEEIRETEARGLYEQTLNMFDVREEKGIEAMTQEMKTEIFANYLKAQATYSERYNVAERKKENVNRRELSVTQEILNSVKNCNEKCKQRDFIKSTVLDKTHCLRASQKLHWL